MNRPGSPAGRSNPSLRCVLMALNRTPQQDSSQLPSCSCSPVQTFSAGSSCKLLTKNAVFRSPDGGGTLVCAGDEASNSTMVSPVGVCVCVTRGCQQSVSASGLMEKQRNVCYI